MRKLYALASIFEEGKEEPVLKDMQMNETIELINDVDVGIGCEDVIPITRHVFTAEVLTIETEKG